MTWTYKEPPVLHTLGKLLIEAYPEHTTRDCSSEDLKYIKEQYMIAIITILQLNPDIDLSIPTYLRAVRALIIKSETALISYIRIIRACENL